MTNEVSDCLTVPSYPGASYFSFSYVDLSSSQTMWWFYIGRMHREYIIYSFVTSELPTEPRTHGYLL